MSAEELDEQLEQSGAFALKVLSMLHDEGVESPTRPRTEVLGLLMLAAKMAEEGGFVDGTRFIQLAKVGWDYREHAPFQFRKTVQ